MLYVYICHIKIMAPIYIYNLYIYTVTVYVYSLQRQVVVTALDQATVLPCKPCLICVLHWI